MNKKILVIVGVLLLFAILVFFKCLSHLGDAEINMTDPQSSINIKESKKNNLFVKEYRAIESRGSLLSIKETWVEYVWKNELINGKLTKVKLSNLQLNLKPYDNILNNKALGKYLSEWELIESENGFIGTSSGGNYTLFLNDELPDTLYISIYKIIDFNNNIKEVIDKFKVVSY